MLPLTNPKVSEKEACALADAFWAEFSGLDGASSLPSAHFLQEASRLRRTGHENSLTDLFTDCGLQVPAQLAYKDIGLEKLHPVLSVSEFISCLSREGKMNILLTEHGPKHFKQFWETYRKLDPHHVVFRAHSERLDSCIPIFIHCDEGTSVKKKGLMIIQWQPLLGYGSSRESNDVNYIGPSVMTRFLYSCILAVAYGGKHKNKPLLELTRHLAMEFRSLFHSGIDVKLPSGEHQKLFPVVMGIKGDWGGLAKVGTLTRSYTRDAPTKPYGIGICHLCMAGTESHPWHKVDYDSMVKAHDDPDPPWKDPPPFVEHIPMNLSKAAEFFRPDVFHTCHKGVAADACANAIAAQNAFSEMARFLLKIL